jgi:hypothetical protein
MKTIIAGSRSITDPLTIENAIKESGFEITEVVCGLARGVDSLGKEWAIKNNIPIKEFPADWDTHGRKAGYVRNLEMVKYADALIAIWDGESKGTKHTITEAEKRHLKIFKKFIRLDEHFTQWNL